MCRSLISLLLLIPALWVADPTISYSQTPRTSLSPPSVPSKSLPLAPSSAHASRDVKTPEKPVLWENKWFPDKLRNELATAERLHVAPTRITSLSSIADIGANGRVFKWVVSEDDELLGLRVIMPGDLIKHSVATKGRPVLAAGEARVQGNVVFIDRHSGHYRPDPASLRHRKAEI